MAYWYYEYYQYYDDSQSDYDDGGFIPHPDLIAESKRPTALNDKQCARWTFFIAGITPLYVITAVANMLVLFVWNAEPKHHTTTYVFKMLATSDVLSSVAYLFWKPLDVYTPVYPWLYGVSYLPRPTVNGHRKSNVYIGLLLAMIRLVKVTTGLSCERIFSRTKLRVICILICTWTISTVSLSNFSLSSRYNCQPYLQMNGDNVTAARLRIAETVLNDHVGFSIPVSLQMIVMLVVMWKVRKYFHERGGVSEELAKAMRRLDYTVFCICTFSFITHGVLRVVSSVLKARTTTRTNHPPIIYSIIAICIGLNGLINVVFYAVFVPRFRQLVMKRMQSMADYIALDTRSIFPGATTTAANSDAYGTTTTRQAGGDMRKSTLGGTFNTTGTEGNPLETTNAMSNVA